MRLPKLLAIFVAAASLGSCSYEYSLRAVVIEGRLAFVVDPSSNRSADCVRSLSVSLDDEGPPAEPEEGDDEGLIRNGGAYRWETKEDDSCLNRFPVFYGSPLRGAPFEYNNQVLGQVKPKPLRIGVVYNVGTSSSNVGTSSSGSGYGAGWFRITADRKVESWPEDPTPAKIKEVADANI